MKKKVALLLLTTIVTGTMLTACGSADDRTSDEVQTENVSDENDMVDSTVGNTTVEESLVVETLVEENGVEEETVTDVVDGTMDSAFNEIDVFINEIYTKVPTDMLPGAIGNMELDMNDMDSVTYYTGLTDTAGIENIVVSESMIGSVAYSMLYIRTNDEGTAQQVAQNVMDNINPAKWICVTAEKQIAVTLGNDVFFVMTSAETADLIYDAMNEIATGKGMTVSEKLEKTNSI